MAQMDKAMFEAGTAKTKNLPPISTKSERPKRECRARKRPYDLEQYATKRLKYDQLDIEEQDENSCTFALTNSESEEEVETESSDEVEPSTVKQFDDNSDIEDVPEEDATGAHFPKASSDQQQHIPVVLNETILQRQQSLTRHSKRLISQFKYLYDQGLRKSIQTTDSSSLSTDAIEEKFRGELKNTFNRLDLFKEGYCVLSNEPFPFYSLCYLCGSLGGDLIYCNSCCEGYHLHCLNEYEQPRQKSSSHFWLCPNCNVCTICGLLNSPNDLLVSCFDCQKAFHFKCLKRSVDEQYLELFQANHSILSLSRLSNSYLINQIWLCSTCIHCDCGEKLYSNERNLLCVTKTFVSQQSQMCFDCFNQLKMLRLEKNDAIEKCHLCEKFIEQMFARSKSACSLLQCSKCQGRFHWKCDGYLAEDLSILPQIQHLISNIVCSKCDRKERDNIRQELNQYKIDILQTMQANLFSIFALIFPDPNQFAKFQTYLNNLQQLHQTYFQSLNLQFFLNDLLSLMRRVLQPSDIQRWQGVIDGCIRRQCPWFQSLVSLTNQKSLQSSQPIPSADHTYAHQNEYLLPDLPTSSLLLHLENFSNRFTNFHQNDTRKCQLCETYSDHQLSLIGRLISFGVNQWVHVGCILAAYAKNLDQPPYILRNIRETIARCQNKYICVLCSKLGASVHCCENECYQRFHCQCIIKYYSSLNQTFLQQLNLKNGFLPNLTTICLKHNGVKTMHQNPDGLTEEETRDHSRIKHVSPLSTVYGDLSNNLLDFELSKTYLCIGSLQIESLGNFDYQINKIYENYIYNQTYPNNYRASRLFWSIENPQKKIRYYLHVEISQSYHENATNHQIQEYPLTKEQASVEALYETCRTYFQKFQKQIDDHLSTIEEFCQKTTINKKGLTNQTNSKKKANTIGTGTTKRIPKATPSCVKRQTPKAALKNVSRPRNRFANEKASAPKASNPKANEIETLFSKTNVSQFALALVQALRHVGQSSKIPQESSPTFHATNGITTEKPTNDILLKQLLKNITAPQQINDSHQYCSTISTQTDTSNDRKLNGLSPHSHSSPTTDNTTNLFLKPTYIPQVDGSIDQDDDDDEQQKDIIPSIIHSLVDQVASERCRSPSEHSMDLSDSVHRPSLVHCPPLLSPPDRKPSHSSSDLLIRLYQQWLKRNFFSVKFTIRNDDGFEIVSDDLESAWLEILQSIRHTRTDMNCEHPSMTNEQLNGHQIFGFTKPIIKSILSQLYSSEESVGTISLPLSAPSAASASSTSSSSSTMTTTTFAANADESVLKKNSILSGSRANIRERKTRERQRFGWLLNKSRKIEYAVKSFEIDTALHHARRILLEEASVSLRLHHLHYFSERTLLVGSSPIHGCGLFTLIDLVEGQMIIEYTGEVVRPCLTDKRERENEGKGFGCYMFTVDSMNVIDATHRGNKARFINHNCQPNCFAKTVLSGGMKHIVIYALKDVARGSELTYDYSFPEEDVKIPCHCGTTQCRIYLN